MRDFRKGLLIRVATLKKSFTRGYGLLNTLAILVGLGGGCIAIIFRLMVSSFQSVFFVGGSAVLSFMHEYYVILLPAIGAVFVGIIVNWISPESKGAGIPEVMSAVEFQGGRIRPRVLIMKALASSICIGSGGSVGREGPITHIGSACGSAVGQLTKLKENDMRILVGCGAAAGIAATFNAPIAGVLFAMEIILREFRTKSFVPIVISSVFGTMVSRHFLGNYPAFTPPPYSLTSPYEIFFYMVLGIVAGFVAILEIECGSRIEDFFLKLNLNPYIMPVVGGLIVGVMGFFLPQIFGVGYEAISAVLMENMELQLMLILIFAKIIAMSVTLGSGGSGGIFAPSLFVGCMLGGAFGYVVHGTYPSITSGYGAYALVGMAAVFAGVSRATLTSIIIVFELTGNYQIILPLMFSCVMSDAIVVILYGESMYTSKLKRKGISLKMERDHTHLEMYHASDIMKREIISLTPEMIMKDVIDIMEKKGYHGFPVINKDGELCGIITHHEIENAVHHHHENLPVKKYMIKNVVVGYPDETLKDLLTTMGAKHISHLPIVTRGERKMLVGFLTRSDIIDMYWRLSKIEDEEDRFI